MVSVLIFIAVLLVLVLAHEWGHFIVAKKSGMRVDEFGFGFPPRLLKKKIGETTYSLNVLPLGGFVKIYGEDALLEEDEEKRHALPDYQRSFIAKSRFKQALVLIAGVAMNVLLAWGIYTAILIIGTPTAVTEADASDVSELYVNSVVVGSPAADAKLPVGAVITTAEAGEAVLEHPTPTSFSDFVQEHADSSISVTYEYQDESDTVTIIPHADVFTEAPEQIAVGVSLVLVETIQYPFFTAVYEGARMTIDTLQVVAVGLVSFLGDVVQMQAELDEVAGPVGLVGIVGDASSNGFMALLELTAFISLNLAVINLLPFPALDGGRLLFVVIEAIRRKAMSAKFVLYANVGGFVFLLALMTIVTVSDVTKLL